MSPCVLGIRSAGIPCPPSSYFPQAWSPLWCRSRLQVIQEHAQDAYCRWKWGASCTFAATHKTVALGGGDVRHHVTCIGHPGCHTGFTPWALRFRGSGSLSGTRTSVHLSNQERLLLLQKIYYVQLTPGTHIHIHIIRQSIHFLEKNRS